MIVFNCLATPKYTIYRLFDEIIIIVIDGVGLG
jgi:hypothetical protein